MKKSILLFLLPLIFAACKTDNPQILGEWTGISWEVEGKPSGRDATQMHFKFNADDTYTLTFGAMGEKGKFKLKGNKLYTTEEGKLEKMVEIKLPSSDTMIMNMNRQGDAEELVLVRQ